MSRSSYVWVVFGSSPQQVADGRPLMVFTVKHELRAWLDREKNQGKLFGITRSLDGRDPSLAIWINPKTLEPVI